MLLTAIGSVQAQNLNDYSFNASYNFSQTTIYDINQGSDNVMWFACSQGLVSFDGNYFNTYVYQGFDISYFNIKFDKSGRLWCANFSGQLFYLENDSLKLAVNAAEQGDFISDYSLNQLPEITLFFSNTAEILRIRANGNESIQKIDKNAKRLLPIVLEDSVLAVTLSPNQTGSKAKIIKYHLKMEEPQFQKDYEIEIPFRNGKMGLLKAGKKILYYEFSAKGIISCLEQEKLDTLFSFDWLDNYAFNKVAICNNLLWVLSRNGAEVLNLETKNLVARALPNISASSVFQDNQGNIWLGSLNKGIFIIPNMFSKKLEIDNSSIAHMAIDHAKNLYFLTDNGSLYYSKKPYLNAERIGNKIFQVAPLFYNKEDNWLHMGSPFSYMDLNNRKFIKNKIKLGQEALFKSAVTIGDGYTVYTSYSYAYFTKTTNASKKPPFRFFTDSANSSNQIRPFRSHHTAISNSRKALYIDFVDGLFCFTPDNAPSKMSFQGQAIQVTALMADEFEKDVVWCTTKSGWLLKLNKNLVEYSLKLPQNGHKLALNANSIFVAGNDAIYELERGDNKPSYLNAKFGILNTKVADLYAFHDTLLVIGENNMQVIPLDFGGFKESKPEVFIKTIWLNNQKVENSNYFEIRGTNNQLKFDFNSLWVNNSSGVYFQYKLEGQEWVNTGKSSPMAAYYNLSDGNYTFKVRACVDEILCSDEKSIQFAILPPYYKSWWFFAFIFVLIFSTSTLLIWANYKNKENQNRIKSNYQKLRKEIYKAKIISLRSQMNPHFIFNALNTIQEFIITNQKDIASDYLADFADLIRIYLNQSNRQEISLQYELEALTLYLKLENMRFNGALNYSIQVDKDVNADAVKVPLMLIQPYVENSAKHGLMPKKGVKNLQIEVSKYSETQVLCSITDNGIGREASALVNAKKNVKHFSFSTEANKNRIELINYIKKKPIEVKTIDLKIDGKAAGTRVEILFPL